MHSHATNRADMLLQRSTQLQAKAGELIGRLRMRELWEQVGATYLVGSARFGLMTRPNIDFEVYVERPDARAGAAVVAELAATPGVQDIQHHDFLDTADPGLYWRVDYSAEDGTLWDFDIWLVPFSHPHAGMAEAFAAAMERTLTPETRAEILALKTDVAAHALKCATETVRGIDIYRAAIEGGVRSLDEFSRWRAENPPAPMETWSPDPAR